MGNINQLLDLWAASLLLHHDQPPFQDHNNLYKTIDAIPLGDVPWKSFLMLYNGELPNNHEVPTWMESEFDVWYCDPHTVVRNMLANPDFKDQMDYAPYHEFKTNGEWRYQDMMSGEWAWRQAVCHLCLNLTILHLIICQGYYCWRPSHSQSDVCSNYPWKWQNDSLCWYR